MSHAVSHIADADQALAWVARLRSDNLSEADLEGFADWLLEQDEHVEQWERALALWDTLEVVSSLPLDELPTESPQPRALKQKSRKVWVPLALAASLLLGVVAIWPTLIEQPVQQHFQAATGELLEVTLADGSLLQLNTASEVKVAVGDDRRHVELVQGEAFFKVVPDKEHPFVVDAGEVKVEVLGTAFGVYRQNDASVAIVVEEGVVRVAESKGSATRSPQSVLLQANQSASYRSGTGMSEVSAVDAEAKTAWRERNVVFDRVSLAEAVAQLNRYLDEKIVLENGVGSGQRISGVFSLQDKAQSVQAVAQAVDLKAEMKDGTWRLSPANP